MSFKRISHFFIGLMMFPLLGQSIYLDSLPGYSFINFRANQLLVPDSSALQPFFESLWQYEKTGKGKLRLLHIGDSHVQGGVWTSTVRRHFHQDWSCGTTERGFVFPYALGQSNSVKEWSVGYEGLWTGCRSAFVDQKCNWGLSGFTAYFADDSTKWGVKAPAFDGEDYQFDEFVLYAEFDTNSFEIIPRFFRFQDSISVSRVGYLPFSKGIKYYLNQTADSASFEIHRKEQKKKPVLRDSLAVFGCYLKNHFSGISLSEAAVNGGKVKSFLASKYFEPQLQDLDPDLVILSLGANDSYSPLFNDSAFTHDYEALLLKIKRSAPDACIILTTPGDAKRFQKKAIKENELLRKRILHLAQKHHVAVWDWFQVMGGYDVIGKWKANKLAAYDEVHLTSKGYELQGQLFYHALIQAYEKQVATHRESSVILNRGVDWEAYWQQFYSYDEQAPIHFVSYVFWCWFFIVFGVFLFFKNYPIARSSYLFLVSLFLYYLSGGFYFILLLFSTVVDFALGKVIAGRRKKVWRLSWLWVSIGVNLSLLGFFKYADFAIALVNQYFGTSFQVTNVFALWSNQWMDTEFELHSILLPVGISFYTFQTMSYAIDVYRRKVEPLNNLLDFGFYVSFFPQLVAGPIVRAREFLPQLKLPYALTRLQFSRATFLILGGLVKKVVISDYVAVNLVDRIFDSPLRYSGFENLLASYGYTLQIYCDFSAYSDIAIGIALLLGFQLPENFKAPYLAENITDFWRRWHMSLSRWLKDYLYISLGGNRKGKVRQVINLMLTMLLGGLWHGAALKFIFWGGIHGLGLVLHKGFISLLPQVHRSRNLFLRVFAWLLTFHFVVYCWLYFRAPDLQVYQEIVLQISNTFYDWRMGEWVNPKHYLEVIKAFQAPLLVLLIGFGLHLFPFKWEEKLHQGLAKIPFWFYPLIVYGVLLLLYQFHSPSLQPFIYFQF